MKLLLYWNGPVFNINYMYMYVYNKTLYSMLSLPAAPRVPPKQDRDETVLSVTRKSCQKEIEKNRREKHISNHVSYISYLFLFQSYSLFSNVASFHRAVKQAVLIVCMLAEKTVEGNLSKSVYNVHHKAFLAGSLFA